MNTLSEIRIEPVTAETLPLAGAVHSAAWQASHSFCSAAFIAKHTPEAQTAYLKQEMEAGKALFVIWQGDAAVGVVTLQESLIENLYVLPEKQNQGHGTQLLQFVISHCEGTPTLWVLSNNQGAERFYHRHGFRPTGRIHRLNDTLWEAEMVLDNNI